MPDSPSVLADALQNRYRFERELGAGAPFKVLAREVLFDASGYGTEGYHAGYAVAPDDRTFYFIRPLPGPPPQILLVRNWFRELKAQVTP